MLFICFAVGFVPGELAQAQAVKGKVPPDAPKPPLMYRGLVPGLSSAAEVRETLGRPIVEGPWYDYKLLYPAEGREGLFDQVHLHSKDGHLSCIEAATVPEGYAKRDKIVAKLGEPEFELRMSTFALLDYTERGLRFVVDRGGATIGVAYVPHLYRRVHDGARRFVDLSHLRQGKQPTVSSPASVAGLKVGTAQVKLTPESADWIDPRYRENYKPHDDLYARIVVFEKAELTIALIGADLFIMGMNDIQPIRDAAQTAGVEYVMFAISHNHAAPDTIGVYGHYPAEYIKFIQRQTLAGIQEALKNLKDVKELRIASRELPMDGARVIGFIRNARNPGLVDPTLSIIQPIGMDDKPLATIVNFACHVEGLEKGVVELSADFPGVMCDQMQRDGLGQAVFLNGAVGGMISGDNRARTHEEAHATGLGLAAAVKELTFIAQPCTTFDYSFEVRRVEVPVTNARLKPLYQQMRRPLVRGRVPTEVGLVKLGEGQLIAIPGELLPELSFEIQEHMTGFPRILVGLANDELGYILPAWDFRDDEYEETMSQGPGSGELIRDTAIRLLEGVK
jgi:hypothetical protein